VSCFGLAQAVWKSKIRSISLRESSGFVVSEAKLGKVFVTRRLKEKEMWRLPLASVFLYILMCGVMKVILWVSTRTLLVSYIWRKWLICN